MKRIILILTISMSISIAGNSQDTIIDTTIVPKVIKDSISAVDTSDGVSKTVFSELEKKAAELMKIRDEEETESFINEAIKYFNGTKRLENGGPSCISCHALNNEGIFHGGLLALDLTNAYSKLNGDNGLLKQLKSPADVRMKITYADNPITDEEMTMLILLLEKADNEKEYQIAGVNRFVLFEYGLIGLALIFILISLIWIKRKRNSVKQDVYNRQIKTS